MANYKNLERIHEIAESLPKLEKARKLLADEHCRVIVDIPCDKIPNAKNGEAVLLPSEVKMNILNVLNVEINKQKEELKEL